ncbi:hypothetical protein Dimus_035681 [Dionaea muscipula]
MLGEQKKQEVGTRSTQKHGHRGITGREIMIFVEDVPESMNQAELRKLFSRLGVVIDAFIPRKLNKAKRRFGFVDMIVLVAAEDRVSTLAELLGGLDVKLKITPGPIKKGRSSMNHGSYAEVVKNGPLTQQNIPTIKVETIGNGRLYVVSWRRSPIIVHPTHVQSFMKSGFLPP